MSIRSVTDQGYEITPPTDPAPDDLLYLKVGEEFPAAATSIGDRWRVVLFGDMAANERGFGMVGATVKDRDTAVEWLRRLGELHAKAARS